MGNLIHSTAIIDPEADLAASVRVGAYAVVGPQVSIGEHSELGPGAQIGGYTRIGEGNRIFAHACVGFEPQDLKYGGGETWLEIGDRNVFREFVTIHRGTEEGGGLTTIADDNLFMAYSHVAHDCHVGSRTIFSNAATLAGHVEIQDDVTVGAFGAVHQFCRVGRHAYIGGFSVLTRDALPWVKTVGQKPLCYGVNTIGLERKGFDKPTIERLQSAMRVLLRSGLNTSRAVEKLRQEYAGDPDIAYLIDFIESSQRGVITATPGRRGGRGVGP
jgi:UDP-N-acetylglucosamine acyltransferase